MPRGQYVRRRSQETGIDEPQSADLVDETPTDAPSPREAETGRRRRRRESGNIDRMGRLNLAIPPHIEAQGAREQKVFRWFLDNPGNLEYAHRDDWDIVPDVMPVAAGRDTEAKHVLCWKYKDWHDADERGQIEDLRERETLINAGRNPENLRADEGAYVPLNQQNRTTYEKGL